MPSKTAPLTSQPTLELTSAQLAEILSAGFEGYLLPVNFSAASLERRMRPEHLDPSASKVFWMDGLPVGAVLVARRGWNSRIAAMGVTKAFRGQGLGKQMLAEIIAEARSRGDIGMVLEVFEQNPAAVRLYSTMGFRVVRRLVGYRKPAEAGVEAPLSEIDPLEFARTLAQGAPADLPWMLSPETFAGYTRPMRAFALEDAAFAMVQDTGEARFILWGLWVRPEQRLQGFGQRMLQALMHLHPQKGCQVVQIVPEELAPGFFGRTGFERLELNQFEMRLEL